MTLRPRSLALSSAFALAALGSANAAEFKLMSPTIKPGSMLTDAQVFSGFGCTGKNVSPALKWSGAPAGTKSFALTVYDPDAPTGSGWWHWVVYNIPGNANELAEGAGARLRRRLPAAGRQAAPLHLHRLRAEDRQARHPGRRHGGAGGLHDQRQQARRRELHRQVRPRQVARSARVGARRYCRVPSRPGPTTFLLVSIGTAVMLPVHSPVCV